MQEHAEDVADGDERRSRQQGDAGSEPGAHTGFVADGVMEQRDGREYVLTQKGRELGTVIVALTEWGHRWVAPQGPPVLYEHEDCGGPVHVHARCDDCGQEPRAADVVAVAGPGADPQRRPARDPSQPRLTLTRRRSPAPAPSPARSARPSAAAR